MGEPPEGETMKQLTLIPRILAIVLMLTYLYFMIVCFAWVYMAPINFQGWWSMFLKAGGTTIGMTFLCAIAGMVEHTRRIVASPTRRTNPFYNYRGTDRIDVGLAARRLAEKTQIAARQSNKTNNEAALFLISQYESHRHEFAEVEQHAMKDIVTLAVEILRGKK
jgi:hypothetical protein